MLHDPGQVTPSSSMCTPVHELTKPIYYHPIYRTAPVLEYTSNWDHKDQESHSRRHPDHRRQASGRYETTVARRATQYGLDQSETEIYKRFVALMAGMEPSEMEGLTLLSDSNRSTPSPVLPRPVLRVINHHD